MHIVTSTQVRGPYGLLRQYQPDLRIFFERWFSDTPLGYGFTRYSGKISSRCHAPGLEQLSNLWREERVNTILSENDLIIEALQALDNRHTKIEQKAWQYYGQILHLMDKHSMLPERESAMEMTERSVREIRQSMRGMHVVNRLWLDIEDMKREAPTLFEDCNLQGQENLGIRCHYLTLPGESEERVRIEGDRVSVPLGVTLGEAAVQGLIGKPLETVVDHPLINGKGYVIWSAVQWGGGTMWEKTLALHTSMFDDNHLTMIEMIED